MKLYLSRKKGNVNAQANYNVESGEFVVLKGSKISETIAYSDKFRGAKSIEKQRTNTVKDATVICDVPFKSASTAANYVTGASTNGLISWKDKNGKCLKEIIAETEINK